MKVVYSDRKSGKTAEAEVPKEKEAFLIGKKIGEDIEGSVINLDGFTLSITGLSDAMGSPSRSEIEGTRKARPLLGSGPGIRNTKKGNRERKLVRGNTVSSETAQVNTIIKTYGSKPAEELFKKKEKEE